ncbi:uncharacterized protein [Littorina saxatilis]|uniref:F5/8 type C domain-containing protein n=1 Tax=Littorina saxatilis TaxID=31220 RepID=A0AAN9BWG6_9CAEN
MSQSTTFVTFLSVICASLIVTSAWDPDAGLAKSLTKASGVRVVASSNQDQAAQVNDGDDNTHWTSHGCMPIGFYLANPLTNVLYRACQDGRCSSSSSASSQLGQATDGSVSSEFQVKVSGGTAQFTVTLPSRQNLRELTIKGAFHADTQVVLVDGSNEKVVGTLTSSDNYKMTDVNVTLTPATAVTLRSSGDIGVFEIGAVGQAGCQERVYVDLGAPHQIQVVRTRHWAGGHGVTSKLVASSDGVTWQDLTDLDPNAVHAVVTHLPSPITVRYIGVQQQEDESKYAKVFLWEIDAYDNTGVYGAPPTPKPNTASLRQMLGVNAIWGWGWAKASSTLSPGQGAPLYAPVASYGRSYHNLNWDILDPDHKPDYDRMAQGHGTEAEPWLNWDKEYSLWVQANVSVHVSVQFTAKAFPVSTWDDPRNAASQYGNAFAKHFGSTQGNGLVRSVEVGNEPWDYPADFYVKVLDGMASGFKAADPKMLVLPGAFQAYDATSTGNYIGTRVTQQVSGKVDVINSHHYSWRTASDGQRVATYPEDPTGTFNEVRSVIRWRNTNTPGKPLWMTEWGWDSPGGGQECTKFPECTTEAAASAYAARGLFLHSRLDVARSTWFFYGNLEECDDHVFCRSGLTSSMSAQFQKKGPYYTLEHLLELLGHTHFLGVVQEDDRAYVYVFGTMTSSGHKHTHLVAWRPVDASVPEGGREITVSFDYSDEPVRAWRLRMDSGQQGETTLPTVHGQRWTMGITAMPTVVQLKSSGGLIG